ncbi:MAG: hypothetical protein RR580_03620 [Christensenellaceae bacterium]
MIQEIIKKAKQYRADDIRFLNKGDACIALLFFAYLPAKKAEYGKMSVSNYYITSQHAHMAAKELIRELCEGGIAACEYQGHDVKALGAACGGFIGLNSLYYHEKFGSYVNIQAIEIQQTLPVQRYEPAVSKCEVCGNCIAACQTDAITKNFFVRAKCAREHTNEAVIPPVYRHNIYQLMGCERCQAACPQNPKGFGQTISFDLIGLLQNKYTKELKTLIGSNYAKRRILVNQAMIYAVNTRYTPAIDVIAALREDEQCSQIAVWAYEQLK